MERDLYCRVMCARQVFLSEFNIHLSIDPSIHPLSIFLCFLFYRMTACPTIYRVRPIPTPVPIPPISDAALGRAPIVPSESGNSGLHDDYKLHKLGNHRTARSDNVLNLDPL